MEKVISVYKPMGLTPLEVVVLFKKRFPEYAKEKVSYAGRLDPMAEGLLLLIVGDENKKRKDYENLKKTYEFSLLLGIETDTYDVLGKITNQNLKFDPGLIGVDILQSFQGKRLQSYPPYSSKTVHGKPLYWWARQNRLDEITIPKRLVEIYDLQLTTQQRIKKQELRSSILTNINKVQGDFRQEAILRSWNNYFDTSNIQSLPVVNCVAICSSGTYIRSLIHELGQRLKTGGIALRINRTAVGSYSLHDAITI